MKKASLDPSRRLDIYLRVGRVNSRTFTFTTSDGQPFPVVDEDLILIVKQNPGSIPNIVSLSYTHGLTVNDNQINVEFTVEQSSFFQTGEYYWELVNNGTSQTWINGKAIFHNGEFDGVGDESADIIIGLNDPVNVVVDQPFVSGGGLAQNIEQVLTTGNDANGVGIQNLGTLVKGSTSVDITPTGFTSNNSSADFVASLGVTGDGNGIHMEFQDIINSLFATFDVNGNGITMNISSSSGSTSVYFAPGGIILDAGFGQQFVMNQDGVKVTGLPISSAGLTSGSLWRNGNAVNIIP